MNSIINWIINNWFSVLEYFGGGSAIISIIAFICKFISNKCLYVKEIKKDSDKDIIGFKRVYEMIDESMRIDSEDILRFLDQRKTQTDAIEHHLYILKKFGNTVGLLKFMVSKSNKYIFVAYLAVDLSDNAAKTDGIRVLLNKMRRKYLKKTIAHKIITEIPQGTNGKIHKSKAKRIARFAKANKKKAYYLDFPYIQPEMPTENDSMTPEDFYYLVIVYLDEPSYLKLAKKQVVKIIESIYWGIYAPSCDIDDQCDCEKYTDKINDILKMYEGEEDKTINLIEI